MCYIAVINADYPDEGFIGNKNWSCLCVILLLGSFYLHTPKMISKYIQKNNVI